MSCKWNDEISRYIITERLVIDKYRGLVGLNGKRNDGNGLKPNDREMIISFSLPEGFFEPILVEVDFPEELQANQVVEGQVVEVAIPVVMANEDKASKVIVRESLASAPSNFLALLKRRIARKLGRGEKEEES